MRPETDPAPMSADERLREVAAILAAGLVRLRARSALPTDPGQNSASENFPETGPDRLEVRPETVLSVHTG